jgi:plasmid stability protein
LRFRRLFPLSTHPPDIIDINDIIAHSGGMSDLLIRGIDDKLKRQLRLRAAENGRSMVEEVRQILREALGVPSPEEEQEKALEELLASAKTRRRNPSGA